MFLFQELEAEGTDETGADCPILETSATTSAVETSLSASHPPLASDISPRPPNMQRPTTPGSRQQSTPTPSKDVKSVKVIDNSLNTSTVKEQLEEDPI